MRSTINADFRAAFRSLPRHVQRTAVRRYHAWLDDPFAGTFQFKQVLPDVWSVRVNGDYRVLGVRDHDAIVWFWIGPHTTYDRILATR